MIDKSTHEGDYNLLTSQVEEKGEVFFCWVEGPRKCPENWDKVNPDIKMLYVLERIGFVKVDWDNPVERQTPADPHDFGGRNPYLALRVEKLREFP